MKDLKKTALRSIAVITALLSLPLCIWGASACKPYLAALAGTAGKVSAKLAFFDPEQSFADIFELGIPSAVTVSKATEIDYSMNEFPADFPWDTQMGSGSVWSIDAAPDETEIPSDTPPLPTPSEDILNALPYPSSLEDNDGPIETVHYGTYSEPSYIDLPGGGQVRNCTSVSNSQLLEASWQLPDISIDLNSSEPQVLIYHTHTTESFEPYSRDYYDASFSCKTTDTTMNMVAVGNAICEELEAAGISVLHDTMVHDYPSYNGSYQSSRETVSEILEQYPSIKIVLDVHRDGIERQDGTRIAPVAEIDGKRAAQIMIISCCDDGGNIPDCMENFKFASLLQGQIESDWQGLTRPVLFDYRFYNQDLSYGSLLIEVGSHGNSIDEAVYSGKLVGRSLVSTLKTLAEN